MWRPNWSRFLFRGCSSDISEEQPRLQLHQTVRSIVQEPNLHAAALLEERAAEHVRLNPNRLERSGRRLDIFLRLHFHVDQNRVAAIVQSDLEGLAHIEPQSAHVIKR